MRRYRLVGPQSRLPRSPHLRARLVAVPPGLRPRTADERRILQSHWGWDIAPGGWRPTWRGACAPPRWAATVSRLVGRSQPLPPRSFAGADARPTACVSRGTSRCRRGASSAGLRAWHVPYHVAIDDQIQRRLVRGCGAPVRGPTPSPGSTRDGRATSTSGAVRSVEDERISSCGASGCEGSRVRANQPYSGAPG